MAEKKNIAAVRREYAGVKKLYHQLGKKAAGKPKGSEVQRDYRVVKREYRAIGNHLGKLTKKKPRK